MKILHVSRTMGQGGAEKIVFQLCRDNKNCEQFVVSCGGNYVSELENIGIGHFMMPDIDNKNPFIVLKVLSILLKIVRKEHIDIIHSHHRMALFYGRIVSVLTGVKSVYTAHNVFLDKRFLLRFSLKNSSIVAVGDGVKKNLIEYYGIPEKRVDTIYNSVKVNKSGEIQSKLIEKKNSGKLLIGNIGRLSKQKGVDVFIRALKYVVKKYPNTVGVIVGDGEDRNELESLVNDLYLTKNVIFMGFQNNVLDIIEQLDFVVLSSRWEGLPLTPIETFSQKKTIIASNITGNNELVLDGINGLTFQMDNVAELASKIEMLIVDKNLLQKLEEGAKYTYDCKYSYNRFIEGYQSVYHQIEK